MATRSRIAIENEDGSVKSIYCHYDGYLSGVGKTLFNHYDKEKLEKLIELGDISSLEDSTESTVAYHRDRGEDLNITTFSDMGELFENGLNSGVEYIYCLTRNGTWLMNSYGSNQISFLQEELEEEGL
jgi:hypothetical protein